MREGALTTVMIPAQRVPAIADDGACGLLVLSTSLRYPGPVAVWILAAGWGAAISTRYGRAWIVTSEGVVTPDQALSLAARETSVLPRRRRFRLPAMVGTLRRDVRAGINALRFRTAALHGPWSTSHVKLVWQYHSLFQKTGFVAARHHKVPMVLFVDAPVVWEGQRWGVHRPGWGTLLERVAEIPQLRSADLVACVSEEVADAVRVRGVRNDRIVVTPCGVDTERFSPGTSGAAVRARYRIGDRFVVGWVGSFRRFHGVDLLLDAFAEFERQRPDSVLLLVGDGLDRARLQSLAARRQVRNAIFTGSVPYADMPEHLAALDAGVVLDPGVAGFHYSPLKLREYMALGLAVIAPRSGEIRRTLNDGSHALLVEPGNRGELIDAMLRLHDDRTLRTRLGSMGRTHVVSTGSWTTQLERAEQALATLS